MAIDFFIPSLFVPEILFSGDKFTQFRPITMSFLTLTVSCYQILRQKTVPLQSPHKAHHNQALKQKVNILPRHKNRESIFKNQMKARQIAANELFFSSFSKFIRPSFKPGGSACELGFSQLLSL